MGKKERKKRNKQRRQEEKRQGQPIKQNSNTPLSLLQPSTTSLNPRLNQLN